jgi:hypothetical protein
MARIDPADHRRGLERASCRLFLRGALSIGTLSLLAGCNLEDDDAVDRVLSAMSRWNEVTGVYSGGFWQDWLQLVQRQLMRRCRSQQAVVAHADR